MNQYVEKDGPYAGDKKNRITSYDVLGTKEAMIAPVKGGGQVKLPPQAPPAAPIAQTVPAAPAPQAAPAPIPQPAAPIAGQAVAAPAPAAPATAPAAELMLDCTICGAKVPASQYGAHAAAHANQQ